MRPRFDPSQKGQQKLTTTAIARRAAKADGVRVPGEAAAGPPAGEDFGFSGLEAAFIAGGYRKGGGERPLLRLINSQ